MSKKKVRCISPWYSLFVYSSEKIKPCCFTHFNLVEKGKKQSLDELWNGNRIQAFRKAMLEGDTEKFCPPQCPYDDGYIIARLDNEIDEQGNLVHEVNRKECREAIESDATIIKSRPIKMQINLSHECNLRCIMCRIEPYRLPEEILQECRKYYAYLSHLDFTGGEPLLSSKEETSLIINKYPHIKMGVVTNGTFLDDFWINIIVEHFEWINISINAASPQTYEKINVGSKWDNIISKIRKLLISKRKKYSTASSSFREPRIVLSMVILKSNYLEMKDLVRLAFELRCEVVFVSCEGDIEENVFYEQFRNEKSRLELEMIINEVKEFNKIYKVQISGIDALLNCFKPQFNETTS